jgi:hypothetical protein
VARCQEVLNGFSLMSLARQYPVRHRIVSRCSMRPKSSSRIQGGFEAKKGRKGSVNMRLPDEL